MLANKYKHNFTTYQLFFCPSREYTLVFSNSIDCTGVILVQLNDIVIHFNEILRVNIKKYYVIDLHYGDAS